MEPEGFNEEDKETQEYIDKFDEINSEKFHPNCTFLDLNEIPTLTSFMELSKDLYLLNPPIRSVIQDNEIETNETAIVDFSFASNSYMLILSGMTGVDHICKVERFIEIFSEVPPIINDLSLKTAEEGKDEEEEEEKKIK